MKVDNLTPVVMAAPGERATCRLRIENTEDAPVLYRLRIIGFDDAHVLWPPPSPPLAAGAVEEVALELAIPDAYAAGHHSVAVEVFADRPGVPTAIAAVTVTVGTIDDVAIAVVPSTIRAHRRGSFRVDIDNRSNRPIDLDLAGEGPDLDVRLRPDRLVLRPGERVRTAGKVKGPRHLVGEPLQHSMTVTARSSSAPSYAPATFQQRPLFPRGLRSMLAVLLIVAIWAGAVGAAFLWWDQRQEQADDAPAALVDTDGDGQPDTPGDQMIDTNGDGEPDTLAAVVAEQVAAANELGPPQEGGSDRPTRTVMGGTVQSGEGGDSSGVTVTLAERDLDAGSAPAAEGAEPAALTGSAGQARALAGGAKLWPARYGRYRPVGLSAIRQTESVQSVATGEDGAWLFTDVAVGQSFELSFAQPGFDTQAFIVTPSADGKPVQVDVELEPASGQISGTIRGPGGPLGNVDLVLTDGTLTFNTASTSDAGTFLITGISTPGTYTLTADLRGFGTEVLQVTLEPGEQRGGVDITMRAGVGSISGRVTESGAPLGGVTLTASSGDLTRTTTSLTEGDRGLFNFPRLPIPGRYTITATLDGYMTQTRLVNLTGNVTGVDFDFVKTTGGIIGVVESSNGGPLTGANIRVSRDERFFETNSAVAPDPGSFTITDLPPGTYLVEFSRFDHAPFSQTVTVAAGQVVDLGRIVLTARDRPDIPQNGSLEVRVVNSQTEPLTGATVRVFRVSDGELVAEQADPAGVTSTFVFEPIDIGTYRIEVTKDVTYRTSTRRISIGLGPRVEVIPLFRLGQVSGRVVDSFQPPGEPLRQLVDYDIQILRINPDGSETIVQNIPVPVDREPDPVTGEIRWESAAASLTSGLYRVHVVNPPPGYRVVPDQELVDGMPPMQFEVVPTDDTPIRLNDIEADRFPELSGTVLAPQLGALGAVTFVPIDDDDLTVALTCPGTDGVDNTFLLDFPRPPPTPGADLPNSGLENREGGPEFDSYFFNAVTLESNDLSGDCTIVVEVPGFEPAEVPVPVSAGDGSSHPVVFRNIAMIRPENVGGTTYWTDRGAPPPGRVDAPGVGVQTQGEPIIEFRAGQTERPEPGSEPTARRADSFLAQTSGAGGAWAFVDPRQVFGTTNYVFGTPGLFTNRIVTIQLDEGGRTVTVGDTSTLRLDDSTPVIDVEVDAVGGPITANVNIATIKGSPNFPGTLVNVGALNVALTGANLATPTLARVGGNAGVLQAAAATFNTPDPGTHTVTVTSTATHDGTPGGRRLFVLAGPQQPPFFQPPATAVSRPPVTFIEQGAVDVRVVDVNGATIDGARVNVNGPSVSVPVTTAATPANVVAGLPVSSAIGAPTPYSVALDPAANPELDLTTATLRVFNENNVQLCGPPFFTCGPTFNVAQGGQPRAVIQVSRLGSITGRVLGIDGLGGQVPLVPPPTGELTVTARRVAVVGPNFPAIPFDCSLIPAEPARPVTAVGDDPGTPDVDESDAFRFSGLAGLYRIEFQHPDYQSGPEEGPPQRSDDICRDIFGSPLPGMVGSVFRVQNDVQRVLDEPFFTLPILPSVLTVSVLNDSLTPGTGGVGAPVEGATVTVTRQGTAPPPPVVLETDDGGQVTASLVPGAYSVRVTRTAPTGEPGHFPVLFDLSILPGGAPVTVRVPLPRIGGRIVGVVGAINGEGNPVTPLAGDLVPPPAVISIEQEYDAPSVQIGAGTVPNEEPQLARRTPVIDPADPADPAAPRGYVIEPVESGVHQLTLGPAPPAFRDPTPEEVTVLGLATETVDLYYVAEDREVTVTVLTDNPAVAPAGAAVQLTHPDGDARPPQTCEAVSATSCRTTFPGVPPEMEPYGIVVNKPPLFAQATGSVQVLPGDPGVPVLADEIRLIGTTAVIQGNVQTIDDGGGGGALATGTASVERVGAPGAPQEFPIVGGAYSFNATSRGLYRVTVSGSTFARRTIDVCVERSGTPCLPGNVAPLGDLGQTISAPTITVPELARFVLTVQNAPVASAELSVQVTGSPPHAPVVTDTPTGFSVEVDPGFGVPTPAPRPNYGFTITSPAGYVPFVVAPQPIGVGATVPLTAAMQPRTIGGTVSGAASAVTVRARRTTDGAVVGDTVSTTGTFTLPGPFPAGGYTVEAAAIGVGIGSEPAQVATNESPIVTGVGVTVAARQVAITFAATPPNTNIAITGGTSGPANGGGLTQPETDTTINWTATLDGWITQTGSTALVISQTDPFAAALTHTGTITVPPMQRPTMSAIVNSPATPPVAVTDATVVACPGATGACTAATTGAVPLPFVAGTTQRYQAQLTGTGSGPWRIVATHATFNPSPLTAFTVVADGTITEPLPITLTLAAPTP